MYFILHGIWIEESNNQFKILMELVITLIYDIDLQDWDIVVLTKLLKFMVKYLKY